MSSSASSSDSTAPRLASILPPRSLFGSRSIRAAVNSRAACSGCSRSWLAAAMKEYLEPNAEEVAKLAVYLASPDSAYVTGQVWNMDGGLS